MAWLSTRNIIIGSVAILFIVLCVTPTICMFAFSFTNVEGEFSLSNYSKLFTEPRQHRLLFTSVVLGLGASLLATIIGSPLGLLFARADLPAKRLLRIAFVIPLVIPPYIFGLAWIYITGSTGLLVKILNQDLFSSWTYSVVGAIVVLGTTFYPLSMLATEASARRVNSRFEEAALLVAKPYQVFFQITLPIIAPSVTATALIIFVLTLSEFGVPGLLQVRVFTTEVFTAFAALYDFGVATALTIPLLVITLIAGIIIKLAVGDYMLTNRRGLGVGLPMFLGKWKVPIVTLLIALFTMLVLLPLLSLCFEVGKVERIILAVKDSTSAITNSLVFSVISATFVVFIAVLLGYGRGRSNKGLGSFVDLTLITLFAIPGTVLGIGLIEIWNRPGFMGMVYKSPIILFIAYLARFVPVATLILAASIRQIPTSFEEASEVSGASWLRTFIYIVLPQLYTALIVTWVVAFIFTFGELGATVLIAPPGESTLPVRVYTLIANTSSSEVAALALMQSIIVLVPLAILGIFIQTKGDKD